MSTTREEAKRAAFLAERRANTKKERAERERWLEEEHGLDEPKLEEPPGPAERQRARTTREQAQSAATRAKAKQKQQTGGTTPPP
jgi:hypothetical protein